MPRRDGTGPMGNLSMNGRGLGLCSGANAVCNSAGSGLGLGLGGRRRAPRRNNATDPTVSKNQKELLQGQKELLESELDIISKRLENL